VGRQLVPLLADPACVTECPDFRLTIRRGRVLAVDWRPWLVTAGPLVATVRARRRVCVAITDVIVVHEGDCATEAIVRFLAGDRESARAEITRWARDVGYRRLWLDDELIGLPGPREGEAHTRCGGCGVQLCEDGPQFWAYVRHIGRFPSGCPVCGADLPQWRLRQDPPGDDDPSSMPEATPRRTPCT
jgi:hypothetical protein